jgi:alanine racemase
MNNKNSDSYSTWITVDLNAIENNISFLATQTGVPIMAVVKANAYGHGIIPVSRAALRGGAEWLGVARVEEALELRNAKITCPILVMGYTPESSLSEAASSDISIAIWSKDQLDSLSRLASELNVLAKAHLKIDTGMSRLGAAGQEALSLAEEIVNTEFVEFEGLFTHYARADETDQSSAKAQETEFLEVIENLTRSGLKPTYVHAANSAASLFRPDSRFSLIRPGISIYGLHPSRERRLPSDFRSALEWKAVLSQVKVLSPGRGVSYGHEYITQKDERIGTVPIGYADGLRRVGNNQVLVGGKMVPVVGRVCMDQVCVQLDELPGAKAGDEVVIIGTQGDARITAEQIADRWGTINYEVVCGLAARIPRIYLEHRE